MIDFIRMHIQSIKEISVAERSVFLRVDFNVPIDERERITEDGRIRAALPTIRYLMQQKAKIIIASHLGRPEGQPNPKYRMRPVALQLSELLKMPVQYVEECIGSQVEEAKQRLQPGEVLLLENLRFYPGEEENDSQFAAELAKDIDVYIADGFGVIHRKHASTYGLPSLIAEKGMGLLIEKEIQALQKIIDSPEKPLVVLVGGVKISDKVAVIRHLAPLSDVVLVGGGVANTFLKAQGKDVGASVVESSSVSKDQKGVDYVDIARSIWKEYADQKPSIPVTLPDGSAMSKIQPPLDFVAAASREKGAETRVIEVGESVPEGWMFLDIGPKTQQLYREVFSHARTIFWNGPLGVFEMEEYASGSCEVARAIAESSSYSVIGGGDTEVVVEMCGLADQYSHVSTGGGASLAFLGQEPLPGLEILH